MVKERSLNTLTLDGGALPFHLINTVYAWRGDNLHEYLKNYTDVLDWTLKVALLKKKEVQALKDEARKRPASADAAYKKIIAARSVLYHFFSAIASESKTISNLANFNLYVEKALRYFEWIHSEKGFQFSAKKTTPDLLQPLWLVIKAAHDLLLQTDPARVKECPRCGWIFLDTTKNNKRRWCSPEECGSIEKARKYYHEKVKTQRK